MADKSKMNQIADAFNKATQAPSKSSSPAPEEEQEDASESCPHCGEDLRTKIRDAFRKKTGY